MLSKRQLYVFLIALMTVTPKVFFFIEKSIIPTFKPKVIVFYFFAYIFKLVLLKIDLCILQNTKMYFKMKYPCHT